MASTNSTAQMIADRTSDLVEDARTVASETKDLVAEAAADLGARAREAGVSAGVVQPKKSRRRRAAVWVALALAAGAAAAYAAKRRADAQAPQVPAAEQTPGGGSPATGGAN